MTFVVRGLCRQACPVVLAAAVLLGLTGSMLRGAQPNSADSAVIRWSEDAAGRIRETLRGGAVVERTVVPWDPAPKLSEERLWRLAEAVYLAPGVPSVAPPGDGYGEPKAPKMQIVEVADPACAARFVLAMTCEARGCNSVAVASIRDGGGRIGVLGRLVFGAANIDTGGVYSLDLKLVRLRQGLFARLVVGVYDGTSGGRVRSLSYSLIKVEHTGGLTHGWTGVYELESAGTHWAGYGDPWVRGEVVLEDVNGDGFEDVVMTREERATAPVDESSQGRPAFDDPAMKHVAWGNLQARWWRGQFHERIVREDAELDSFGRTFKLLE